MSDLVFKDAFMEKPKTDQPGGCSDCVIVIRDCGPGTLESYAISRYKSDGWGYVPGESRISGINHSWLDQESNGYRVVRWAYLPEL